MSVFIGYPSFMAYQMMKGKQGNKDGFPSIPGTIARYSALGLTNEEMSKNPVWVDKTGNGHDLQMKNFAWKGMSGVGGYGDENYQTFYKFTLDDYVFIASPPGVKHMNFTFRVTGLQPGNKLTLAFFGTTNTVYGTWNKDGIYTVDADIVEAGKPTYFYNGYSATRGKFTIEILPLYPGALVFDGVDDYGTCDNFPILTKEKGYTVVALRQYLFNATDKIRSLVTNAPSSIVSRSTLTFELTNSKGEKINFSFGKGNLVSDFEPNVFSYMTSKSYNGKTITPGDVTESNERILVGNFSENGEYGSNVAIWELVFLDHDATEEELTKIKDYFVKTYPWLFPYQAWTVTGKTNEDEDRATIANITGNGNDLVLSNFGFIEGSGYNEQGEYAGYLVTDGVDDEIISAKLIQFADKFTIVGDWKFMEDRNDNAGLLKANQIYIYNATTGMRIYLKQGSKNYPFSCKKINALTSDGWVYDEKWDKYKVYPIGSDIDISSRLFLGFYGSNFTKIALKNLGIYNDQLLSKDDCIKAYNYLQTLKAK
nr:MAG: hypothetical protein [Bacteriophage sp.]